VTASTTSVAYGDRVIAFCNGSNLNNVVYLIDVDKSTGDAKDLVEALYNLIVNDSRSVAQKIADATVVNNNADATATEVQNAIDELTAALDDATSAERTQIANLLTALGEKLAALGGGDNEGGSTDEEKAQAVVDAYDAYALATGDAKDDAKAAAYAAAANYTPADGDDDSDAAKAYAAIQALAVADASDFLGDDFDDWTFAALAAAADKTVDENVANLLSEDTEPSQEDFKAAMADYDYLAPLYEKAVTLAAAYDAWDAVLSETKKAELWNAYVTAYEAISEEENTKLTALEDASSAELTSANTTYDTAYGAYATNAVIEPSAEFEIAEGAAAAADITGAGTKDDPYVVTIGKNAGDVEDGDSAATYVTPTLAEGLSAETDGAWTAGTEDDGTAGLLLYTVTGKNSTDAIYYFSFVPSTADDTVAVATVADFDVVSDKVIVTNATDVLTKDMITAANGGTVLRLVDADPATKTVTKQALATGEDGNTVCVEIQAADGFTTAVVTLTITRNT
jgi:hypothetical protein